MKHARIILAMTAALGLTACGGMDVATRNAPLESAPLAAVDQTKPVAASVTIVDYEIAVPRSLKSSEANMYYPVGDIVWREDPLGDRHAQIAAIFDQSLKIARGETENGALPVKVEITLTRFHALTQKTRYTVGGVHSIAFNMTVTDPVTGAIIVPMHAVQANLKGYGGTRALMAESKGLTQKVRITKHLANVVEQELRFPGSTSDAVDKQVAGLEAPKPRY